MSTRKWRRKSSPPFLVKMLMVNITHLSWITFTPSFEGKFSCTSAISPNEPIWPCEEQLVWVMLSELECSRSNNECVRSRFKATIGWGFRWHKFDWKYTCNIKICEGHCKALSERDASFSLKKKKDCPRDAIQELRFKLKSKKFYPPWDPIDKESKNL